MTLKRFLIIRKQFTKFKSLERSQVRILSVTEGAVEKWCVSLEMSIGCSYCSYTFETEHKTYRKS